MAEAPYGSWNSPITADLIVAESIGFSALTAKGGSLFWLEGRPAEGGRSCIVQRDPKGAIRDLIPPPYNARTRVHEYGGGAYLVTDDCVIFANFADQQLYRIDLDSVDPTPRQITTVADLRYADLILDARRNRIICVSEDHRDAGHEPRNTVVAVDLASGERTTLLSGADFYSSPRLDQDGSRLAWLSWNHPDMPWDNTVLHAGDLDADGNVADSTIVAGGASESVVQPLWSPDGVLHFVSDRSGWWNLYRLEGARVEALQPMAAEFSGPHWAFGMASYGFRSATELICSYSLGGSSTLASIDIGRRELQVLPSPYSIQGSVQVEGDRVYFLGAAPTLFTAIIELDLTARSFNAVRMSNSLELDAGYYSIPEAIEFPTAGNRSAHAFYYPPANRDFSAPAGERPPLLVKVHGGPTAATSNGLSLQIQYWTSRGIGVLDVNYGGSTGYGREYRQRLDGNWGVVDVEDTEAAARYLIQRGDADPERLAIRGGSAGGYTTLALLTFRDLFKAGASYYGIGDLETLARDTHKFEARYLDSLVGPYPERLDLYRERSPIHHVALLDCPIIFLQGAEDRVVPPSQAEAMVEVLRQKGLPVAYLLFDGEQHGFRRAENIKRALEAELYFYSRIFRFELADEIEPLAIENLK